MNIRATVVRGMVSFLLLIAILLNGCGPTQSSVAGTYELDKEAVRTAAQKELDAQKESEDESMDAFAATMAMGMIESMSMTLTLSADGGATIVMQAMGDVENVTGTWTLDGSAISITAAAEGEAPETIRGTVTGDTISLHPDDDEDMPFDLVFKRKS